MKTCLALLACILSGPMLMAQSETGICFQMNTSSQWITVPTHPQDGTFSYHFRPDFGGGFFYRTDISTRVDVEWRISYVRKGFTHAYTDAYGFVKEPSTLQFIGMEQLVRIHLLTMQARQISLNVGFRNERLIHHDLGDMQSNPAGFEPIQTDDYHRWSFSGVAGIGCQLSPAFSVDLGMNPDIAPSMNEQHALVRNFMWFMNCNVALNRLWRI